MPTHNRLGRVEKKVAKVWWLSNQSADAILNPVSAVEPTG